MARITIEDCSDKVENRFQLVHLAAKRVKQLRNGKDALVKSKNKSFSEMIIIATKMKEALLKGQVKEFADLLHESWLVKKAMNKGIANEFVEDAYQLARNIGALGGKLLGAGHSGYLLIYASPVYQKKIKEEFAKKGISQELFKFSSSGLEVWSTKR